jgi:glycosyltransferase involved in cell wall biosynthesis
MPYPGATSETRRTCGARHGARAAQRYDLGVAISVVIPAHNEQEVIARCLEALTPMSGLEPLEVVVVCNGCDDLTAEVARRFDVQVVETSVASKTVALNLGDARVAGFPRFYVDADVVLSMDAVLQIAAVLERGPAVAASPTMDLDLRDSTWPVRAYYRIWTRLPYVREGMIGVGVYALSEVGRSRFEEFPEVIADDGFVRMLFPPHERTRVDAPVRVTAPRRMSGLLSIKTRSRLGLYQLGMVFPQFANRERGSKSYGRAIRSVASRPWLWPAAAVYGAVQLVTRRKARDHLADLDGYRWQRDTSSRDG